MPVLQQEYMATEIGATNALLMICKQHVLVYLECQLQPPTFNLEGIKKYYLIGADKMSSIVDYTDRSTCIIFGMVVLFYLNLIMRVRD
jgi:3-oxoacyl-[acyl-carrier-protein] synthase-3